MKKYISLTTKMLILGLLISCVPQNVSSVNSPVPSLSVVPTPIINSIMPTIIPTSTPLPTPTSSQDYTFPSLKSDLQVNDKSKFIRFYPPSASIDEKGNGIIIWAVSVRKIQNFLPVGDEFIIDPKDDLYDSTIKLNSNGKGLIVWRSPRSFAGPEVPKSHIYSRQIENYSPVGDVSIVLEDFKNYNTKPILDIDDNGNGSFIWSENNTIKKIVNNKEIDDVSSIIKMKKVNNFNISDDFTEITSFKQNQQFDPLDILIDVKNGNGLVAWVYGNQDNYGDKIYIRKISNLTANVDHDQIVIMDDKNYHYIQTIKVSNSGNGLIIWNNSDRQHSSSPYITQGKKIENYNISGSEINLANNLENISLYIDDNGDGDIVGYQYYKGLGFEPANIYLKRIKNYVPVGNLEQVNNNKDVKRDFPNLILNKFGDGIIFWDEFEPNVGVFMKLISKYNVSK